MPFDNAKITRAIHEDPLFARLTDAQFNAAYNALQVLRMNHRDYRDDQLLFYALAATVQEPK